MSATETFVIVGTGLAGAEAAASLRAWRLDGRVLLVGDEPPRPYERPPLPKGYLRWPASFDGAVVRDADHHAGHATR